MADWLGNPVSVGDHIVHFKGGRYDSLDLGEVLKVTEKGNYRIRIVRSSRGLRAGEITTAVRYRSIKVEISD